MEEGSSVRLIVENGLFLFGLGIIKEGELDMLVCLHCK